MYVLLVCYCFPGHILDLTVDPISTLTLTNTTTQVCWNFSAVHDTLFENSESFTFTLTGGVSVELQGTATVTVMDNDGETLKLAGQIM